jgi:hypothetical protein
MPLLPRVMAARHTCAAGTARSPERRRRLPELQTGALFACGARLRQAGPSLAIRDFQEVV